jgi:hypothetical protein
VPQPDRPICSLLRRPRAVLGTPFRSTHRGGAGGHCTPFPTGDGSREARVRVCVCYNQRAREARLRPFVASRARGIADLRGPGGSGDHEGHRHVCVLQAPADGPWTAFVSTNPSILPRSSMHLFFSFCARRPETARLSHRSSQDHRGLHLHRSDTSVERRKHRSIFGCRYTRCSARSRENGSFSNQHPGFIQAVLSGIQRLF